MITYEEAGTNFRQILKVQGFNLEYLMQEFDDDHDMTSLPNNHMKPRSIQLRSKLSRVVANSVEEFLKGYQGLIRMEAAEWIAAEAKEQQNRGYGPHQINVFLNAPSLTNKQIPKYKMTKVGFIPDNKDFTRFKQSIIYAYSQEEAVSYLRSRFGDKAVKPVKKIKPVEKPRKLLKSRPIVVPFKTPEPLEGPKFPDYSIADFTEELTKTGWLRYEALDKTLELQKENLLTDKTLKGLIK